MRYCRHFGVHAQGGEGQGEGTQGLPCICAGHAEVSRPSVCMALTSACMPVTLCPVCRPFECACPRAPVSSVQAFVARLLVAGLLLVLILGLCGLAVEEVAPTFPSWTLFAAAGTVVATLLGWVGLSVASVLPSRFAPWSSSSTLLWIDK